MKLIQDPTWLAVHFPDRTVLKKDWFLFPKLDWEELLYDVEVEPTGTPGHYKVANGYGAN